MSVVVPEPLPAVQVDALDTDPPRRPGRAGTGPAMGKNGG